MTAISRKKEKTSEREPFDAYFTPKWVVNRLLEKVQLPTDGLWIEPAAGRGDVIKTVNSFYGYHNMPQSWCAIEIQEKFKPDLENSFPIGQRDNISNVLIKDFAKIGISDIGAIPKIIITNPPYRLAMNFIKKSLELKPDYIIMLLRLNFLASAERQSFFKNNMPDVYVLPDRPIFKGKHSDPTEYCWMVWDLYKKDKTSGKVEVLNLTPKDIRKQERNL